MTLKDEEIVLQHLENPKGFEEIKDLLNKTRKEHFPEAKFYKWAPILKLFTGKKVIVVESKTGETQVIQKFRIRPKNGVYKAPILKESLGDLFPEEFRKIQGG
jgi:hypothetical protein